MFKRLIVKICDWTGWTKVKLQQDSEEERDGVKRSAKEDMLSVWLQKDINWAKAANWLKKTIYSLITLLWTRVNWMNKY